MRSISGLGAKGRSSDSLMSSLPSELIFNDLRDTCRRAKKSDRTIPANMHTCAARSVAVRTKCLPCVDVEDKDWNTFLPMGKNTSIKSQVHSAMRCTDASLGVSHHGLTRQRTNKILTKPHHFTARLQAFNLLCDVWHAHDGDLEEKEKAVRSAYGSMWMGRLLTHHIFIRVADSYGASDSERLLILSSTPNAVKALKLDYNSTGECFVLRSKACGAGCDIFLLAKLEAIQARRTVFVPLTSFFS